MDSDSSGALFRTRAVSRSDSTICKFRPTWRSICLQHDPQLGVLADKTGGLLATPARLYPRATPPGRTLGACHSAVSPLVVRWGRRSTLTATCRVFRRPQRPKDDAVVKWQGHNRRLSGPLRFPRYRVHPKRRQSLLARVPGLSRCLLVDVSRPSSANIDLKPLKHGVERAVNAAMAAQHMALAGVDLARARRLRGRGPCGTACGGCGTRCSCGRASSPCRRAP